MDTSTVADNLPATVIDCKTTKLSQILRTIGRKQLTPFVLRDQNRFCAIGIAAEYGGVDWSRIPESELDIQFDNYRSGNPIPCCLTNVWGIEREIASALDHQFDNAARDWMCDHRNFDRYSTRFEFNTMPMDQQEECMNYAANAVAQFLEENGA